MNEIIHCMKPRFIFIFYLFETVIEFTGKPLLVKFQFAKKEASYACIFNIANQGNDVILTNKI
ncbi:hypothetical protein D3C85_1528750 [compost metagenome]